MHIGRSGHRFSSSLVAAASAAVAFSYENRWPHPSGYLKQQTDCGFTSDQAIVPTLLGHSVRRSFGAAGAKLG